MRGEALMEGWDWSGGPPGSPVRDERCSRWVGSRREAILESWEALPGSLEVLPESRDGSTGLLGLPGGVGWPEGREGLGGPPSGPGRVRRPSQMAGRGGKALLVGLKVSGWVRRPSRRAGKGREIPQKVPGGGREALPKGRMRTKGSVQGLGGVGKLSWRVGTGGESLTESWDWLADPPKGSRGIRRGQEALQEGWKGREAFREGRETLPQGRQGSREPPGGLAGVRRPSRRAERGREFLPEGRERWGRPPRGLGGVGRLSWRAGTGQEALLEGQEGLGGVGGPPGGPRRV